MGFCFVSKQKSPTEAEKWLSQTVVPGDTASQWKTVKHI